MAKFLGLFGKESSEKKEDLENTEEVSYKQDPVTGEEILVEENSNSNPSSVVENPAVLIPVLKARLEELDKQKKEFNESFLKMNQTIGELRGKVLEQEKTIQRMQSKVLRAEDMVNVLDPINLNKAFEEEKAKIDSANSKVDSFIAIADSVKLEINSAKSKIIALGGEVELKKFNKDVQELLKKSLESQSKFSAKLEKSQTMFNEMQKNYSYSLKYFTMLETIESSISKIRSEQYTLENSLKKYVSNELYQKNISEISTYLKSLEQKYKELIVISGLRESSLSEKKINISSSVKNIEMGREVDIVLGEIEKKEKKKNIESDKKDDLIFMRSY